MKINIKSVKITSFCMKFKIFNVNFNCVHENYNLILSKMWTLGFPSESRYGTLIHNIEDEQTYIPRTNISRHLSPWSDKYSHLYCLKGRRIAYGYFCAYRRYHFHDDADTNLVLSSLDLRYYLPCFPHGPLSVKIAYVLK